MKRRAARRADQGRTVRPMLATLIDAPFDDVAWVFETKWDGFRVIARTGGGVALLFSRNGKRVTGDYPRIAAALGKIRQRAVLDGELVALDKRGRSRFQLLQQARLTGAGLRYYAFDLLFLNGRDLRRWPLVERKSLLKRILPKGGPIRFSRHIKKSGIRLFRAARRRGLEGVVAKREQGRYVSGRRTREWLKIKTGLRQEAVIVGFTRPRRTRKHFGALVLALRSRNAWQYAGHTGTGFDAATLKALHRRLQALTTQRGPLREKIANEQSISWVRPKLVCEVKFTEWTDEGRMRHPVFVGLRSDKPARQVVAEHGRRLSLRARGR
ncbi:MAG: non-homologous end-joining DNA ligase [Pseudorhodoplanes sp.]|nr:non-homologous end-joining DNA ligase [Pseudorhodoplanes sp.]